MSLYPETITSKAAQAAMEAHTNINLLGAIMALCESSLGYGSRMHVIEGRIVRLCQKESQVQLALMDKARGRAAQAPGAQGGK